MILAQTKQGAEIELRADEARQLVLRIAAPGLPQLEAVLDGRAEARLFDALRQRSPIWDGDFHFGDSPEGVQAWADWSDGYRRRREREHSPEGDRVSKVRVSE